MTALPRIQEDVTAARGPRGPARVSVPRCMDDAAAQGLIGYEVVASPA